MQEGEKGVSRRWRTASVLAAGIAIGAVMVATPAGAHISTSVAHLWNEHIKPKADQRYARGPGRVIGDSVSINMVEAGSPYEGSVLTIPGVGAVRYRCTFAGGLQFAFSNGSTWFQEVLEDQGGQADPTRIDLNLAGTAGSTTPFTPSEFNDLVTWFIVNQGSNEWTTKVTVGGMRFGNNICYMWAQAVVTPPAP